MLYNRAVSVPFFQLKQPFRLYVMIEQILILSWLNWDYLPYSVVFLNFPVTIPKGKNTSLQPDKQSWPPAWFGSSPNTWHYYIRLQLERCNNRDLVLGEHFMTSWTVTLIQNIDIVSMVRHTNNHDSNIHFCDMQQPPPMFCFAGGGGISRVSSCQDGSQFDNSLRRLYALERKLTDQVRFKRNIFKTSSLI